MSLRKRPWTSPSGETKSAWQVDYTDANGKRWRKQFAKKKDADTYLAQAKVDVRDGTHIPEAASETIGEAGEAWIKAKIRSGRERSTIEQYRQHLDLHIKPFACERKLSSFNAAALSDFEEQLHDAGRSPTMVRKVRVSLGSIIAHAQKRGKAARNVVREMRGIGRDSDAKAERRSKGKLRVGVDIPTPDEIKAILGHLEGRWRPLLLTAIFTGLRVSELRGLTWDAIDFEKKVLHVRQRADRFNDIGRPKSEAGDREVPIPDIVLNTLREWKLQCPRRDTGRKDAEGEPIRVLELVFPNGHGKVESLANIVNRGLVPAQIRAGVTVTSGKVDKDDQPALTGKYPGMHALRHFYASWLINRPKEGGLGLTPKQVQERLGHSSITLTMNVYSHPFPSEDDGEEMHRAAAAFLA